jgi:hypothetical protein
MVRWICAALMVLTGCGSEPARESAELAELCGVEGPLHLIALEADQRVYRVDVFEDRLYYATAHREGDQDPPVYGEPTLWSSGLCGEQRRKIADGITSTFSDERWPGLLLGCREQAREVVSLDPTGLQPAHVVFADIDCWGGHDTSHGLVSLLAEDEGPGTLVLHRYPVDARTETSAPIVLLDPGLTPEHPISRRSRLRLTDDDAFILTDEQTLLRISLRDEDVVVEQTGVRDFEVSSDGRYLLYQDLNLTGDPDESEGAVILLDRIAGTGTTVAQTDLAYSPIPLAWVDLGVVPLMLSNGMLRVHFLPGLDFVDTRYGTYFRGATADGRWLLQGTDNRLYLGDAPRPEYFTYLFDGTAQLAADAISEDGVTLMNLTSCCSPSDEGPLLFVPFDGAPRHLADRVSRARVSVDDRRLLTTVEIDEHGDGELVLVDLDTHDEQLVDTQVGGTFRSLSEYGDRVFLYSVTDGERTGIWLIRLPDE